MGEETYFESSVEKIYKILKEERKADKKMEMETR